TDDESGIAGPFRLHRTTVRNGGDRLVIGAEVAKQRDVFLRVVGEGGDDAELALLAGLLEGVLRRIDADLADLAAALVARHAVGDPAAEQVILPRALAEAAESAVFDLAGGLEQDQAVVGIAGIDAAALHVAGQGGVVELGVVAEQRQAETALALERS